MAKEKGAKRAIQLPVSVPSHCELMRPAAKRLAEKLQSINMKMPYISVVQNVSAAPAETVEQIKENLIAQLYSPVLWASSIASVIDQGIERSIECGAGKVLSGLNKKIHKPLHVASLTDLAGWEKATG